MPGSSPNPDVHPYVSALLREVARLEEVLEERLDQIQTRRFSASNDGGTVEVVVDGMYRLVDVFIADGLLRAGASAAQNGVNEAIARANRQADASAAEASAKINAVVAHILGRPSDSY